MRKATSTAILLLISSFCIGSVQAADVGQSMKDMGKQYRLVMKDTDATTLQQDLGNLKIAAQAAAAGVPDNMKDQPADSPDRKAFTQGMQEFIAQVDVVDQLAKAGHVDQAKTEAAKLKDLMKEYHGKLIKH